MAKRTSQFQTIRSEGAILPPDVLRLISSLQVDGATAEAFHLPPGSKLNEAISQSWTTLQGYWRAFQEDRRSLAPDDAGTSVTNERWLLPLFKELAYGRLVTADAPKIDERTDPVKRFYSHTPIHFVGCNVSIDRRSKGVPGATSASPHSMAQEFLNRSEEHLWAFVSNGLQLRILRNNISLSRQAYVEFDLEAMMEGEVYAEFALLWLLCHQSRVEAAKPEECWLEQWSKLAQEQGTRVLKELRSRVRNAIEALGRGFISHPHNDRLVEKLRSGRLSKDDYYRQLLWTVYRLLLLFVAEDRELLHPPEADEKACQLYDTYYSTRRLRELASKLGGSKQSDLWCSLSLVFEALGKNEGCAQLALAGLGSFLWRADSTRDLCGPAPSLALVSGEGWGESGESVTSPTDPDSVLISNDDLLLAIRELAFVEQDRVRRAVDYRNLGSQELGSVYESLLELHPVLNADAKTFELGTAPGNDRKTTGSYYTPDSLIQCVLDSALDPVVEDRLKGKRGADAEQAILEVKVCDPACGSGHFLIAAAHRLARHLARVRTAENEPSPTDYQQALRDVIGRCIYGVDINPMAVELCKVSLWMEAIEPGRPLSFLDSHIRCGNSLVGTTPALLAGGIPDDAFKPIEGDVKAICAELKKNNKRQRTDRASGQGMLYGRPYKPGNLPSRFAKFASSQNDSVEDVVNKQLAYARLVSGADYQNARLLADTWCAAFVWKKDESDLGRLCPTENDFWQIENNPHSILPHVLAEVRRLADQYQFFHWHFEFPEVFVLPQETERAEHEQAGWSRGFDVVLGNPPWEKIHFREEEWFAQHSPNIANAKTKAQRKQLIARLPEEEPALYEEYYKTKCHHEHLSAYFRFSGTFPLTGVSRINLYSLFAELSCRNVGPKGRVGLVIASGLATDDNNKKLFESLVRNKRLVAVWDFENRDAVFPALHRMYKFCLFFAGGSQAEAESPDFAFFLTSISELSDEQRHFSLSLEDLATINPDTKTCPTFRNRRDANLARFGYGRVNAWSLHTKGDTWPGQPKTPFNMSNDSNLFMSFDQTAINGDLLPIYESKFIHQFDHRYAEFALPGSGETSELDSASHADPTRAVRTRYALESQVKEERFPGDWFLVFRDVTNASNERTTISSVIPALPCVNSLSIVDCIDGDGALLQVGNMNSYVFDYFSRQKAAGVHLNHWIWKQLPFVAPEEYESNRIGRGLKRIILELTYTAWDLQAFALDCGYDGPPFRWDEERRFLLRCELDAAYFHLYFGAPEAWGKDPHRSLLPEGEGAKDLELREMFPTPRDAVDYIMETFPIVRRKDIARTELKDDSGTVTADGTYITKNTILRIYDEMAECITTGQTYRTQLEPPPGPPLDDEGEFIPMVDWDESDWPEHIHQPCESNDKSS